MPKSKTKVRLGPELACAPYGKTDAEIHEPILDNPKAHKAFQDQVIRDAVADGMPLAEALRLFGNQQ